MTSHNKHYGGLHVVLGECYKNAHNFIKKKNQICQEQLYTPCIWSVIIYHPNICSTVSFPLREQTNQGKYSVGSLLKVVWCTCTNTL